MAQIIFSIYDRRGKSSTTSVYLADTEGMTRITLFSVAWADALDNLIGGVIRTAKALFGADISGLTANTAAAGSDVEEIGSLQYVTSIGTRMECNIPAFTETLIDNNTGEFLHSAAAVQALYELFEGGIDVGGGVMIVPTDVGGEYADSRIYARERSRNSGARKKS
jgi:hypothetical protein